MSGGRFSYDQYKLLEIAEAIQEELDKQGKEMEEENSYYSKQWREKYPEDCFYESFSEQTNAEFNKAISLLRQAYIYVQRADWFLSGDDSEETFHERLKQDLDDI